MKTITIIEQCQVENDDDTQTTGERYIILPINAIEYDPKDIIETDDDFAGSCLDSEIVDIKVHKDPDAKELTKEISFSWCDEDVLSLDDTLTPEQVSEVLNLVERKHDCNNGITWETLEFWISEVKGEDK